MSKEYLGLYPNKREGGIYSDEPEYQKKIEEIYKLKAHIAELEAELEKVKTNEQTNNQSSARAE